MHRPDFAGIKDPACRRMGYRVFTHRVKVSLDEGSLSLESRKQEKRNLRCV